jgi:hypothetical protein
MTLDPFDVIGAVPPEWRSVAAELVARLGDPTRPWLTPAERRALDAVIGLRPYLVTNAHRARCRRCGSVHAYLTLGCIERPFTGWTEVFALVREQNVALRLGDLVPIDRATARALIERIRARGFAIPDLPDPAATEHALRRLAKDVERS